MLKGLNSRLLSHFPPKLTTILLGTRVEFLFVAADMRIAWTLGPPYLIVYWWCWCSNDTKFNTKGTTINYRVCKYVTTFKKVHFSIIGFSNIWLLNGPRIFPNKFMNNRDGGRSKNGWSFEKKMEVNIFCHLAAIKWFHETFFFHTNNTIL